MRHVNYRTGMGSIARGVKFWLLCAMTAHSLAAQATAFDPGKDFSLADNPHGVWEYGYSATRSLAPDQFRLATYAEHQGAVGFWHPAKNNGPGDGYYPYVAFNTDAAHTDTTIGWAVRSGEVAMEGSNTGQYSVVRFVAPRAGTYEVTARFEGIHSGLSTTDVHVLHNATVLFDAEIDGYGGDSTFRARQGATPVASYGGKIELRAGDVIAFAVGYGKNASHVCDTTGLVVTIIAVTGKPD